MKNTLLKFKILFICFLAHLNSLQASNSTGDFFTNIGKIYVVVGVIVLVFLGLVYFLIRLESRIKKLEEEIS